MKNLLLIGILLVSFVSVSQVNHCITDRYCDTPTFDSLDIEREEHIFSIEEKWPSSTLDTLRLEVFKPSNSVDPLTERPFILLIHGGAFFSGNRSQMNAMCMEFARRGFVTATMDYRLGWDCDSTTANVCFDCGNEQLKLRVAVYRAVQDARAATRYILDISSAIGIDTSAMFIQGTSAGSITALHTNFWSQAEADVFSPTGFSELGALDSTGLAPQRPFSFKAAVNNCGALNPLASLVANPIPIISFHDELDCIVPMGNDRVLKFVPVPLPNCGCQAFFFTSGSQSISNNLANAGVCYNMNKVTLNAQHCSYPPAAIIGKATCFLKSILCDSCTSSSTTDIWNIPDCTAGTTSVGLPTNKLYNIRVFPNPSNGELRIKTYSEEAFTIELVSLEGKVIRVIGEVHNNEPVDLSEFKSGVYYLKISQSNEEYVIKKVVLQN